MAKSDPGSDAEYSKIAIARGKADQLRAEAEECIGQLAFVVDEKTSVEVQQPEDLPTQVRVTGETQFSLGEDTQTQDQSSSTTFEPSLGGSTGGGSIGGAIAPPPPPIIRPPSVSAY